MDEPRWWLLAAEARARDTGGPEVVMAASEGRGDLVAVGAVLAGRGPLSGSEESLLRAVEARALDALQGGDPAGGADALRVIFEARAARQGLGSGPARVQGTTAGVALRMVGEAEAGRAILARLADALPDDAPADEAVELFDALAEALADVDLEAASQARGEAVDFAMAAWGPGDARTGMRLALHGEAMLALEDADGAEAALSAALTVAHALGGPDTPAARALTANLANAWKLQGRLDDAHAAERGVLAWADATLPDGHPARLDARRNLGVTLLELDRAEEARQLVEEALEGYLAQTSILHPDAMATAQLLAAVYDVQGDERAAAALLARMERLVAEAGR